MTVSTPRPRAPRSFLRRPAGVALLLLGLAVVVLGVCAWSLKGVRDDAASAKVDLILAKQAMSRGDAREAQQRVDAARRSVDDAQDGMDGLGARVWASLPGGGTVTADVRHLLAAMDHATTMAETGVEVYPSLTGAGGRPLYDGERLDVRRLPELTRLARDLGRESLAAQAELDQVDGGTPLVGGPIRSARDEADATIGPIADGYRGMEPMLDVLPRALGADGEVRYLIAIMNPAELRWSGGATLSMTTMHVGERGRVDFGEQITLSDLTADEPYTSWTPVQGNPFHFPGEDRASNATFNPDWPVSAQELQRAWSGVTGGPEVTGVIAVDLPALAGLLDVTGPLEVEGLGTVTGDNLVEVLAGSYDETSRREIAARRRLNASLAEVFRDRMLGGGDMAAKGQVLADAVQARRLVFWSSRPKVQSGFTEAGITGALGDASQDYLGVFTQNTNQSKADYWQRRSLDSRVTLREDGSARVRLTVRIHNDTPPYVHSRWDRKIGYWTRFSSPAVLQMLPEGARLTGLRVSKIATQDLRSQRYAGRPYYRRTVRLRPTETGWVKASYVVPHAAVVEGGSLRYRLVFDPQAIVNPQTVSVSVRAPEGYAVAEAPDGWSADGGTATLGPEPLDRKGDWSVVFRR